MSVVCLCQGPLTCTPWLHVFWAVLSELAVCLRHAADRGHEPDAARRALGARGSPCQQRWGGRSGGWARCRNRGRRSSSSRRWHTSGWCSRCRWVWCGQGRGSRAAQWQGEAKGDVCGGWGGGGGRGGGRGCGTGGRSSSGSSQYSWQGAGATSTTGTATSPIQQRVTVSSSSLRRSVGHSVVALISQRT